MSAKSDNLETAPKTYWSIISKFLNTKKIPIIPLILVNGKLISDFQEKANLFNNHLQKILNVLLLKILANYQTLKMKLIND